MARPKKDISAEQVAAMASVGCTIEEMATILDCGAMTLKRRFGPTIKNGKSKLKMSLRHLQVQKAKEGNVAMLIWLGKNLLGQSDKLDQHVNGETKLRLTLDASAVKLQKTVESNLGYIELERKRLLTGEAVPCISSDDGQQWEVEASQAPCDTGQPVTAYSVGSTTTTGSSVSRPRNRLTRK